MNRYSDLPAEVVATIAAQGFDVYTPTHCSKTFLYFTDGVNIGYMQRGDWGGYSLSTVHVPNRTSGTGFRITDDNSPSLALTCETLQEAFKIAPAWASANDRASVRKYADMSAFLRDRGAIVPLELVAKGAK